MELLKEILELDITVSIGKQKLIDPGPTHSKEQVPVCLEQLDIKKLLQELEVGGEI